MLYRCVLAKLFIRLTEKSRKFTPHCKIAFTDLRRMFINHSKTKGLGFEQYQTILMLIFCRPENAALLNDAFNFILLKYRAFIFTNQT